MVEKHLFRPRVRILGSYYTAMFNPFTGTIIRNIDENKIWYEDTIPELLDISITKQCNLRCSYCYTSAGKGKHMSIEELEWLLDFMGNDTPFQVALGGGEPGCNPNFDNILEIFAKNNIVPNYTTNGYTLLNDKYVKATVKYCGGVALTYHWDNQDYFKQALNILTKLPIQRNIHIIITHKHIQKIKHVIDELIDKVDVVVLLEFHSIGRGRKYNNWILTKEDIEYVKELLISYPSGKIAVGASLIPIAINAVKDVLNKEEIEMYYYNPEGILTGYIDEDLNLAPSSFWEGEKIKLRDFKSFREAYNSPLMKELRRKQYELREKCKYAYICNGGMHAVCNRNCNFHMN